MQQKKRKVIAREKVKDLMADLQLEYQQEFGGNLRVRCDVKNANTRENLQYSQAIDLDIDKINREAENKH